MLPPSPIEPTQPPPFPPKAKPKKRDWGNAVFRWELLRASRKIRFFAFWRVALIGVFLLLAWVLWNGPYESGKIQHTPDQNPQPAISAFSQGYCLLFFTVQQAFFLVITPLTVTYTFFEARKTFTNEALKLTDLTPREIYHGKLWARVAQSVMILPTGLPILFLAEILGSVSIESIVVPYLVTGITICSSAALTAAVSLKSMTFRECLLLSWFYVFVVNVLIFPGSPFLLVFLVYTTQIQFVLCPSVFYVIIQGVVILVSVQERKYVAQKSEPVNPFEPEPQPVENESSNIVPNKET